MNFSNGSIGFGTGKYNPSYGGTNRSWNKGKKCPEISEGRKNGKKPVIPKEKRSELTKKLWEIGIYDKRPLPTEEHKKKISEKLKGKKQSDYQKQRAKEIHTGKVYNEETREKIRKAAKIREAKLKTCPHCGLVGNGPVMRRWHFSNCKSAI